MTVETLTDVTSSLEYHLAARNLAPSTISQYVGAIRKFYLWLSDSREPNLKTVTRAEVERFMTDLRRQGLASSSLRWHFAGLAAAMKWYAAREGIENPMWKMEAPRVQETQKDVVDLPDIARVLANLDRQKRYRDAAAISLMAKYGLRVGEVIRLDWEDIDWRSRELVLRETKNRTVREIPLDAKMMERFDLWRRKLDKKTGAVFMGQRGRLGHVGFWYVVHNAFAREGIPNIGPHDLRHSWATAYMDANPDGEKTLKFVGGWRSNTMVERYSKQGRERRAKEAFRQNSPLSGI